jgi:hypothetical protein
MPSIHIANVSSVQLVALLTYLELEPYFEGSNYQCHIYYTLSLDEIGYGG